MKGIRLTRRPGQPGTKKLLQRYGDDLICVRYRYDEERGERIKTVELAVDRAEWSVRKRAPDASATVRFRIAEDEDLLRRAVLLAGGRWEESSDLWSLRLRDAAALGLTSRIVQRRRGDRNDQP